MLVACIMLCGCTTEPFQFGKDREQEAEGTGGGEMQHPTTSVDAQQFIAYRVTIDASDKAVYSNMEVPRVEGDMDDVRNHDFTHQVTITYSDTGAHVDDPDGVVVNQSSGTMVSLASQTTGVEYILQGESSLGCFLINSTADFKVTLQALTLNNPAGAAINSQGELSRMFITTAGDVASQVSDGAGYNDSKKVGKAPIYARGKIIFAQAETTLSVVGNNKHAIASEAGVIFHEGCQLQVKAGVKDGVHATDDIMLAGGSVDLQAVGDGDGLESEEGDIILQAGYLDIETLGKKCHALKTAFDVRIADGCLHAIVKGDASKCISCDGEARVEGGKLVLMTQGGALYDATLLDFSTPAAVKCGAFHMTAGKLEALSTGVAGKGINSDGDISITGTAVVKVITEGLMAVEGELDASPKAITATGYLTLAADTVWVKATGGQGSEGLDSKASISINQGEVALYCYDDCVSAKADITVNDGFVYAYSSNNDGMDAAGTITIAGGTHVIVGADGTEEGLDSDNDQIAVTGGTLVCMGAEITSLLKELGSMPSIIARGNVIEGKVLGVKDAQGNAVLVFQLPRTMQVAHVTFTSTAFEVGQDYELCASSEDEIYEGEVKFGLYFNSKWNDATVLSTLTLGERDNLVDVVL